MRVCVIGARGQLGAALVRAFGRTHEVVAAVRHEPGPGQVRVDLSDAHEVRRVLAHASPEVVLVAGAMTYVDGCEADPAACAAANVGGPRAVAEWATGSGARVVIYSTDQVFDGTAAANDEDDPVGPLNQYARSKVEAERLLRALLPDRHLVLRTAWLYGPDEMRRNFALRLVARIEDGERVTVPSDQWGTPTYTDDVALATRDLVERGVAGTFHAVGSELIDRVSLARRICVTFGVDAGRIAPTPTSVLGQVAPRPLRLRLANGRLTAAGVPMFRGIDAGLAALARWWKTASPMART